MAAICPKCNKLISSQFPMHDCLPRRSGVHRVGPGAYEVTVNGRSFDVTKCRSDAYNDEAWFVAEVVSGMTMRPDMDPFPRLRDAVAAIRNLYA